MNGFCAKIGFSCLYVVAACAVLFAGCMLLASMYAMPGPWAGTVGYGAFIALLWVVLEYLGKVRPGFRRFELAVVMLCFALLYYAMLLHFLSHGFSCRYDSCQAILSIKAGKVCYHHPARNLYWCDYEILLSFLATIFGKDIKVGQVVNIVCCVGALYPIYKISELVGGRRIARFSTLVVGAYPALVMGVTILTSEILSSTLMVWAAYFMILAMKSPQDKDLVAVRLVFCGVLLGCSNIFKSIAIVYVMSALTVGFAVAMILGWKMMLRLAVMALIVWSSFKVCTHEGQRALSGLASSTELGRGKKFISGLLYEFALGLDPATEGRYLKSVETAFQKMDVAAQKDYVKKLVVRNLGAYPRFFAEKFVRLHGTHNDRGLSSYLLDSIYNKTIPPKMTYATNPQWIAHLSDSGTMLFRLLFLLGAIGLLMSVRKPFRYVVPGLFAATVVLIFGAIEMLIEGYARYKTSIYPFYFLMLPYTFVPIQWLRERLRPLHGRLAGYACKWKSVCLPGDKE